MSSSEAIAPSLLLWASIFAPWFVPISHCLACVRLLIIWPHLMRPYLIFPRTLSWTWCVWPFAFLTRTWTNAVSLSGLNISIDLLVPICEKVDGDLDCILKPDPNIHIVVLCTNTAFLNLVYGLDNTQMIGVQKASRKMTLLSMDRWMTGMRNDTLSWWWLIWNTSEVGITLGTPRSHRIQLGRPDSRQVGHKSSASLVF